MKSRIVRQLSLLALALLALLAVARSLVIVDQTESVFITEFGRPIRLIEQPGLHFKWPHQSARAFDRRLAARHASCPRDADPRQEEPRDRLVRELANRRRRPISANRAARFPTLGRDWKTWPRRCWRPSWAFTISRDW